MQHHSRPQETAGKAVSSDRKRIFVIGAPKCATTSFVDWLGRHPAIAMPTVKEPGYFRSGERRWILDAHHPDRAVPATADYMSDADAYEALWGDAPDTAWRLDGSTDYFSDTGATERIAALAATGQVKAIIILRDPVDRMRSEYFHTFRDKLEPLGFRAALEAEDERMKRRFQPLFFHAYRSRYWLHVNRWRDALGDDLLVMDYRELDDPGFEARVLGFLGLETGHRMGSLNAFNTAENETKIIRNPCIHKAKQMAKRLLAAAGLRKPETLIVYPEITDDDLAFAAGLIRDDILRCLDDPRIPTQNWTAPDLLDRT